MLTFANRQGAACRALTLGSGPLMTGGEAVILDQGDEPEEGVVKTEFWSFMGLSFGWRVSRSGMVT